MLASAPPSTLGQFSGQAAVFDELEIQIRAEDFNFRGGEVALGFLLTSPDTAFDPQPVILRDTDTNTPIIPLSVSEDVTDASDSLAIVRLETGTYQVTIPTTAGAEARSYELHTFLVGDLDGDRDVDGDDLLESLLVFGTSDTGQVATGDANLDGRVSRADLNLIRANLGVTTEIGAERLTLRSELSGQSFSSGFSVDDDQSWRLSGQTLAHATVQLDVDADGVVDRSTTADVDGAFAFDSISLPDAGLQQVVVTAIGGLGQFATATSDVNVTESFRITEISPATGEAMVSPSRHAVVRFTEPVDPATVTTDAIRLISLGQTVPGSIRVSSTRMFATFMPDTPWPASTEVRLRVDGSQIRAANGDPLDADANGSSGGIRAADFRTVPATLIPFRDLFSLDASFANELDAATVSDELRQTFANEMFELADDVTIRVAEPSQRWIVFDRGGPDPIEHRPVVYVVEATGGSLVVQTGTTVVGRIIASEPDAQGNDAPLGGVTIRVDGFADLFAVTDVDGNFTLGLDPVTGEPVGLPSPEYYVHIDGSTVTTVGGQPIPPGGAYPNVGKRFPSIPGQTFVKPFDIYLPFIPDEAIHAVTPDEEMKIHLPQSQIDEDPMLAMVELTLPPGSLIADDGAPGTQIGIYRVDSDRLPAPLPDGLNHSFDITVQADVANFDVPAPITFPNMDGLAPGEQALLMSFDHARSEWVVVGTMTVSEDGTMLMPDAGVGIRAPGWHGVQSGARQVRTITPLPMHGTTFEAGLDVQGAWDPPELFFNANFSFPVLGSEMFPLNSDFFGPIPIAFRRSTTFFIPAPFDSRIPAPLRETLFKADFEASLILSVGVEVGIVATAGSSSVRFQLTLTPPSARIESSVTISSSPVCGVPILGSIVCKTHQLPTIPLAGSGRITLPSQSVSLPAPLTADEAMQLNQFMATATVDAGITTMLSISPIAFLDIVTGNSSPARGVPSNEEPDIVFKSG